jgi:homoserine kinase
MIVLPADPLATSRARAVLPAHYSRQDAVANIQAASLLGLAFALGRGDLLRPAMADRIHQPYRAEICPLLPRLLPLAGSEGILGVALSGAGPSVLLIVDGESVEAAEGAVRDAMTEEFDFEVMAVDFEQRGAAVWKRDGDFGRLS